MTRKLPPKPSRRKRLTKSKGHRYQKKHIVVAVVVESEQRLGLGVVDEVLSSGCMDDTLTNEPSNSTATSTPEGTVYSDTPAIETCSSTATSSPEGTVYSDHDYFKMEATPTEEENPSPQSTSPRATSSSSSQSPISTKCDILFSNVAIGEQTVCTSELLLSVKKKVDAFLHHRWISIVDKETIHVMCMSIPSKNKAVQRSVEFSYDGSVALYVHRQSVPVDPFTVNATPFIPLDSDTINDFVDRIICIVNSVRSMEVCSGFDDSKYEEVWSGCNLGERDKNLFGECRYVETFRSNNCLRLVRSNKWRCPECSKMAPPLRRRKEAAAQEERSKFTSNTLLTEEQKLKKLADQRRELDNKNKQIFRLQERMQELIEKEGVTIDTEMSGVLTQILDNSERVTPAQAIFLQQQIKASQQKNASGMKWHPTMIRLALSIYLTSPAAYQLMRDTGMIKLPCSRTLFDYSHAKPVAEGIDRGVLEKLAEKVQKLSNKINEKTGKREVHKKYVVLMADEMYICQNLIFQKSTGKMIGFTSLDEVDSELKKLEHQLDSPEKELGETIASRVMVYMVKGVTNGLKFVVATYAVANMSVVQMKIWTWLVIGALERSGVGVIAFVCDGSAVNRAFIQSHKAVTPHPSGIVFDTINKCARNRKLFFLSDVPHLLKTIRNCLLNSRWDNKKSRRKMMKNKSRISWDYIIRLYEAKRGKTLRKSYKLNPMNVFPDSYARMKVKYAGQVASDTVSQDLSSQGWPEAMETALFLKKVNDWFDCLNGAHSSIAKKKNKPNVAAYTSVSDPRFKLLDNFLDYLDEWEQEAKNQDQTIDASLCADQGDMDESEIDEGGALEEEEDTHVSKRLLSRQTLRGIYMTTLAFRPLVTFMLEQGASFINARVFTQDPLEQHFSKLRAGQGGSTNPNLGQVLKRTHALDLIGEMGMKRRKGNSGECGDVVEVTTDKLPKLQSKRIPKFSQM